MGKDSPLLLWLIFGSGMLTGLAAVLVFFYFRFDRPDYLELPILIALPVAGFGIGWVMRQ